MTDHEESFAASLDALSRGESPAPDDDLTRFVADAQASWPEPPLPPPGSPPRLTGADRHRLWESIRQEATSTSVTHEGSNIMSASTLPTPTLAHRPTGWGATIARWQPVLSVAVMFIILAGLVGVAYTGLNRRTLDPSPTAAGFIAQSTPTAEVECELYGPPLRTSSELRDMSLSDWPLREYVPVAAALPTMGRLAVEVYENWISCAWAFDDDSSASPPPVEMMRFWSDRMQYTFMLERNPPFRPGELTDLRDGASINTLLLQGSLPLNRPPIDVENPVTGESLPSFASGDVYELSDGRYGVVIGSISTEQLVGSAADVPENEEGIWLTFLAFTESDGHLLIDQYVSFCVTPPVIPFAGTSDIDACGAASDGAR